MKLELKSFRALTNHFIKEDNLHRDVAEVKARELLYKGRI